MFDALWTSSMANLSFFSYFNFFLHNNSDIFQCLQVFPCVLVFRFLVSCEYEADILLLLNYFEVERHSSLDFNNKKL